MQSPVQTNSKPKSQIGTFGAAIFLGISIIKSISFVEYDPEKVCNAGKSNGSLKYLTKYKTLDKNHLKFCSRWQQIHISYLPISKRFEKGRIFVLLFFSIDLKVKTCLLDIMRSNLNIVNNSNCASKAARSHLFQNLSLVGVDCCKENVTSY